MATYFTILTGVGLTNLGTTVTHSLGIAPASLQALCSIHQILVTNTAPVGVNTIGTNIITVFSGVGTLVTCDVIVWQQHSLVS